MLLKVGHDAASPVFLDRLSGGTEVKWQGLRIWQANTGLLAGCGRRNSCFTRSCEAFNAGLVLLLNLAFSLMQDTNELKSSVEKAKNDTVGCIENEVVSERLTKNSNCSARLMRLAFYFMGRLEIALKRRAALDTVNSFNLVVRLTRRNGLTPISSACFPPCTNLPLTPFLNPLSFACRSSRLSLFLVPSPPSPSRYPGLCK